VAAVDGVSHQEVVRTTYIHASLVELQGIVVLSDYAKTAFEHDGINKTVYERGSTS
jgi:hypothetical protein